MPGSVIPLFQVDAFAERLFSGNPAAVCLLEEPAPEEWMQAMATEMNLSETAYLRPLEDGYELRWFTPASEVDLCGHATLASAWVLWDLGRTPLDQKIAFHTRSGVLRAGREKDWITLDFPAQPARQRQPLPGLLEALGVEAVWTGANLADWLVEICSPARLRSLQPDFAALKVLPARGIIVTSPADNPRYDFLSRFFAPRVGVDEDPVTGSAHCCLGPYWSSRLDKSSLLGYQASARGGVVGVEVLGDRVLLRGQAVPVFETTVAAPPPPGPQHPEPGTWNLDSKFQIQNSKLKKGSEG